MTKRRAAYFSWNATEHSRLRDATHDEIVLYLTILKPLADFRSGVVGTFAPKNPLSFARLGALLGRPATQGRAAIPYDGTQAKRVLERLEGRGLVCEIVQVGGALILRLPLSPIGATGSGGKLSDEAPSEKPETPQPAGVSEELPVAPPVLTITDLTHQSRRDKHSIEQPPPIPEFENGAGEADSGDESHRATSAEARDFEEPLPLDESVPWQPPPRNPQRGKVAL